MGRYYLLTCALAFLALVAGCSRYAQLNEDFKTYQPPDYGTSSPVEAERNHGFLKPSEFDAEKEKLKAIKARWEKALMAGAEKEPFFNPPPLLAEKLKPTEGKADVAAAALRPQFSMNTLLTLTILRNQGIKAAQKSVRAILETYSQVMALDDILRQYNAFSAKMMASVGPVKGKEPMRTKFSFPGVLSLKGEIVTQSAKEAFETLRISERNAVTTARKAYWNLLFVFRAEEITKEVIDLYRHLEEVAAIRYETGRTNYQDVIKVRIGRELLEERLNTLLEKKENVKTTIREILYLPAQTGIGRPKDLQPPKTSPPLKGLYAMAQQYRQELRRIRARIGKMERMIEMAETMILPPFTLNLSMYEDRDLMWIGGGGSLAGNSVSPPKYRGPNAVPKPWYGIEDAYLRQSRQALEALQSRLKEAEAGTSTLVRQKWFQWDLALREEMLYRNAILKLSKDALDVSTQGYEAGNVSFADVISSYRSWLDYNLAYERKISDLGAAWAELESAVGKPLTSRQKETSP